MSKQLTQLVALLFLPGAPCSPSSPVGPGGAGHPGNLGIDTRGRVGSGSPPLGPQVGQEGASSDRTTSIKNPLPVP